MKKLIRFLLIIILILSLLIIYARYGGTRGLITKEYQIETTIDDSFDGLKIVHFSDLHYLRITNKETTQSIIEEINLLKYNVGSIVSPVADKSVDLMIVDYVYKKYNDLYVIEYKTCQILGTDKSHIIKYGEFRVLPDTKLTISRNNNLDSLLN